MKADNDNSKDERSETSLELERALEYYMSEEHDGKPYRRLSFTDVYCFEFDDKNETLSELWSAWLQLADESDEAYLYSDSVTERVNAGLLKDDDQLVSDAITEAFEAAAMEAYARHKLFEEAFLHDATLFEREIFKNDATALYRHYDAFDRLLYVGISLNTLARLAAHRNSSHWAGQIRNITIEVLPTRDAALAAEKVAILSEHPLHNKMHNRRHRVAA